MVLIHGRRAVTLIEMLIVVAVLAPAAISILHALGQARIQRANATLTLSALEAVRQEIDRLRIEATTTGQTPAEGTTSSTTTLRHSAIALLTTKITPDPATGLLRAEVVATFPGHPEGLKPVAIAALLPRPAANASSRTEASQP